MIVWEGNEPEPEPASWESDPRLWALVVGLWVVALLGAI
jgi:hypothetical protein